MQNTLSTLTLAFAAATTTSLATAQQCQAKKSCETSLTAQASKDIVDVAASAGTFKTLIAAAKAAGLVDTLRSKGPLTVFAPTDDAFAKLPKGTIPKLLKDKKTLAKILSYHVVPGSVTAAKLGKQSWAQTVQGQSLRVDVSDAGVSVDGARVVKADVMASNGVIHVIDSVMLPRKDIVDTAVAAGSFKTLAKALQAAGLVDALKGDGPFTVFAPTDAAFAKLPEGTVAALLEDIPKLKAVLTYHVIEGRVLSSDIPSHKNGKSVSVRPKTLQGSKLTITRGKNGVTVDEAKVIKADIVAGNGIIHVIDTVVLPD